MKHFWNTLKRYAPWLLLLLAVDAFSALLLWLSNAQAFEGLVGTIVLASLVLFSAIVLAFYFKEQNKRSLFQAFLMEPDEVNTENRADELSFSLQAKLDYVRSQLQEDITQMLYYARLGSSTKDYRLETVELGDAMDEVLEDYAPLLEEKQFLIENRLQGENVYTDRRGLQFMLRQIISNAIKYSGDEPKLTVSIQRTAEADILIIADNGTGVKSYDLPYIFQKGFTGDSTDSRKKATGMGLYLTKKMADDLNLKMKAESQWGEGLTISIVFPKVSLD